MTATSAGSFEDKDSAQGSDPAVWRGRTAALLDGRGRPCWEWAWSLLEHVRAGLSFEPMASEIRAVRLHAAVVAATAELEFAGLRVPRLPAPALDAGSAPIGWADLRAVLESAGEVLSDCVRTAPDPAATARAVMYVGDALAAVDDG